MRNTTKDMVLITKEEFEHLTAMGLRAELLEGLLDIAKGDYITLDELEAEIDKN